MKPVLAVCYGLLLAMATLGCFLLPSPTGAVLLEYCFLPAIVFAVLGAYEVSSSPHVSFGVKAMWITGFIFLLPVAGLLYLISGRRRIKPAGPAP